MAAQGRIQFLLNFAINLRPHLGSAALSFCAGSPVDLPEGAKLFLWLAASGRDDSAFQEPDAFDLYRAETSKSLEFGFGIHYCVGAALGKLEAQLVLEALTRRFPRLRLVDGQEISFHPNISFRGPQALWVMADLH